MLAEVGIYISIAVLIGYLFGCINGSQIIGRIKNGLLLRMEGMELGLIRMIQYIIGSFVIIGHNFPFQMKFLGK
ncbi:hypothetical protein [Bacillus kwashiorkori]|uniref:hypothetical protein n=1 Tax=Bacillus kwashiorkori TaxID=1522318 RepID=UPI0007824640|nr:hypothetical protein [Bacillus kwashiorkori]